MPPEQNVHKERPDGSPIDSVGENGIMDIEATDSSDEGVDMEEEHEYVGYKLLSQEEIPNGNMEDNVESLIDEPGATENNSCVNLESADDHSISINYENLICSVLDDDLPATGLGFPTENLDDEDDIEDKNEEIPMTESQAELVKNAMSGFKLPDLNVPTWAKSLSEDEWKESLKNAVDKLKNS